MDKTLHEITRIVEEMNKVREAQLAATSPQRERLYGDLCLLGEQLHTRAVAFREKVDYAANLSIITGAIDG